MLIGEREAILSALVCRTFRHHCMVFVQTKWLCHRLHVQLGLLGIIDCNPCELIISEFDVNFLLLIIFIYFVFVLLFLGVKVGELHGNLSQPQRLEALRKFKVKLVVSEY